MRKPLLIVLILVAAFFGLLIFVASRTGILFKSPVGAFRLNKPEREITPTQKPARTAAAMATHDDLPVVEAFDEENQPVEDAIACADLGLPALGRSGPDGRIAWAVSTLPFDHYGLLEFLVHHEPDHAPVNVRLSRFTKSYRVVLKRGNELAVEVMDEQKRPIPKAEIRLLRRRVKDPDTAFTIGRRSTDAEGRVLFRGLEAGPIFVTASAHGFGAQYQQVFVSSKRQTVRVTMHRTDHEIRILVLGPNGSPVAGADVELLMLARSEADANSVPIPGAFCSHVFTRAGKTNSEGRISFDVLKGRVGSPTGGGAGDFDVQVTSGSYVFKRWQNQLSEGDVTELTLDLPARATLQVILDRRGSRAPVSVRFDLPFKDSDRGHWRAPELELGADESQFSLEVPAHRPGLVIQLTQQGRPVHKVVLAEFLAGETRTLTIALPETRRLRVTVRERGGNPAKGAIRVGEAGPCPCHGKEPGYCGAVMYSSIKLSKSGEAELDVQDGNYLVRFMAAGRIQAKETVRIAGDTSVQLVADDLASIRGRIVDAGARPVQGVTLLWNEQGKSLGHMTVSGSSGEFTIDEISPAPGLLFMIGPLGGAAVAYEGPPPASDLTVRYSTMRLRGMVRGGAHSTVSIRCSDPLHAISDVWGHGTFGNLFQADADGQFEAELLPGKWDVQGWIGGDNPWYREVKVQTASGEMSLTVP